MAAQSSNALVSSKARRKPKATGKTVAVNVALPAAVHKRVRMKAIAEELTLEQAITAACECWIKA